MEFFLSDEYIIRSQVLVTNVGANPKSSLFALLMQKRKIQSVKLAQPHVSRKQMKTLATHCKSFTHVHLDCMDSEKVDVWPLMLSNPNMVSLRITQQIGRLIRPTVMTAVPAGIPLPNLRSLSLQNINMHNQIQLLDILRSTNGNVLKLDLSYCAISPSMLLEVVELCPQLTALAIPHIWAGIPDSDVAAIAAICPYIKHLNSDNVVRQDAGILSIVTNLVGLESLCICKENYELTDTTLVHISAHCANTLHTIHLGSHCEEGPYYSLRALNTFLETCTKLRTFYWWCYERGGKSFKFSAAALRNLTTIVINSDNTTEAMLKAIGMHALKLQVLALRYEYETHRPYSYEGLKSICLGCPELRELYINTPHHPATSKAVKLFQVKRPEVMISYEPPNHLEYNIMNM